MGDRMKRASGPLDYGSGKGLDRLSSHSRFLRTRKLANQKAANGYKIRDKEQKDKILVWHQLAIEHEIPQLKGYRASRQASSSSSDAVEQPPPTEDQALEPFKRILEYKCFEDLWNDASAKEKGAIEMEHNLIEESVRAWTESNALETQGSILGAAFATGLKEVDVEAEGVVSIYRKVAHIKVKQHKLKKEEDKLWNLCADHLESLHKRHKSEDTRARPSGSGEEEEDDDDDDDEEGEVK